MTAGKECSGARRRPAGFCRPVVLAIVRFAAIPKPQRVEPRPSTVIHPAATRCVCGCAAMADADVHIARTCAG